MVSRNDKIGIALLVGFLAIGGLSLGTNAIRKGQKKVNDLKNKVSEITKEGSQSG